ncbi:hypothetical protein CBR_g41462 [Chara braunii]|uniref:Serpin domain-containing protein n=1 Tax=Chara braunii TaxID=69332 RepID=A0A388LVV8_CHABU|nr:hypothetical protein CBR_g41462 [Chara braunii]|eukprot:GBG86467.1 hypothetical protein CBR_g41462 [Chara braunii]
MLELYRAVLSKGGEVSTSKENKKLLNVALSPMSITLALAVVSGGSAGNTLTEIIDVLRLPTNLAAAHSSLTFLRRNLLGGPTSASTSDSAAAAKVQIATGLWVTDRLPLKKEYEDHVALYEARVVPADFVGAASQVREEINRWVSNQTSGKIQQVVPEGLLREASVFVLVNALYFKGSWQEVFCKRYTAPGNFMIPAKGGGLETVAYCNGADQNKNRPLNTKYKIA